MYETIPRMKSMYVTTLRKYIHVLLLLLYIYYIYLTYYTIPNTYIFKQLFFVMIDDEGNELGKGERICSTCGIGCRHHTNHEASVCLGKVFSGKIKTEDW